MGTATLICPYNAAPIDDYPWTAPRLGHEDPERLRQPVPRADRQGRDRVVLEGPPVHQGVRGTPQSADGAPAGEPPALWRREGIVAAAHGRGAGRIRAPRREGADQ